MNLQEADILRTLLARPFINQRILAEETGHSLGVVNRSIRTLTDAGYLDNSVHVTDKAREEIRARSPRNAVILAAGFGMRMVPINYSTPKALIEVNGERLIDRIISQLHEAGIRDITVVVGFMKECFEYLMDDYGVDLLVNPEYASRNNLHSLAIAADRIQNTYVIPCDLWCSENPFSGTELYSWYMVSDLLDEDSKVRVNRKRELVKVADKDPGNSMIGISYLRGAEATVVKDSIRRLDKDEKHRDSFWEDALYRKDRMILPARVAGSSDIVEINTYEQLRDLDAGSNHLKSDAIQAITLALDCKKEEITDITVLKKGMTNRSFLFSVDGRKFIMRIPGEGTDRLIDRRQEAEVYRAIQGMGLCDDPVYINPKNGYKITTFLDEVRTCDPHNEKDLRSCMTKLRAFHEMKLSVGHEFNILGQIEFYESLWAGVPSVYPDYKKTKDKVLSLKSYTDSLEKIRCLCHIDAVPDNFLFYETEAREALQLTDWEYAGMQDPHVDIAMFCIYSLYNKEQCDRLIDIYFDGNCDMQTRIKIYCYIAMCGLLWSNWCEFKRTLGVEFGEYSLRQYRFAKDFYRYARELIERNADEEENIAG